MSNGGFSTGPLLEPILLNQIKFSRYSVTCLTALLPKHLCAVGKLTRLSLHPGSCTLEGSPPEVEVKTPWRSMLSGRAVSTAIYGVPR